jgi:hypothetical protein
MRIPNKAISTRGVFFIYIKYYIPVVMLAVEYLGITNSMNIMAVQIICNRTCMGCLRFLFFIFFICPHKKRERDLN